MKKIDDKQLFELIQKLKLSESKHISENMRDMFVAAIAGISKIRPNLGAHNPLTFREALCLNLLAIGKNPDQCADMMGIKMITVQNYEKRIRRKLHARNRTHALCIALIKGFLVVETPFFSQ